MATAPQDCVFRTVTLEGGETFTLPPNAVLVGASNVKNITSTCDIPTLETPLCYEAKYVLTHDIGDATALQSGEYGLDILIGNISYTIFDIGNHGYYVGGGNSFPELEAAIPTGTLTDITISEQSPDSTDHRKGQVIAFKAIPSIGSRVQFKVTAATIDPSGLFAKAYAVTCPDPV